MEYYAVQDAVTKIEQSSRGSINHKFIDGHINNIRTCAHTMMTTFLRMKNNKNRKHLEVQKTLENYQDHKEQVNEIVTQLKEKYE